MIKVAIVGAEENKWDKNLIPAVKATIREILSAYHYPILISGHCPKGGVDIWAEEIARELEIGMIIFKPEVNQWEDYTEKEFKESTGTDLAWMKETRLKGYKSRNIEIAKACNELYCIEPAGRKKSGGIFTLKEASKLGKKTHLIVIK